MRRWRLSTDGLNVSLLSVIGPLDLEAVSWRPSFRRLGARQLPFPKLASSFPSTAENGDSVLQIQVVDSMHRYHTYGNLALVLPKHTTDQDKVRQYHAITPTRLKRALDEASESNRAQNTPATFDGRPQRHTECSPEDNSRTKHTTHVRPRA